ncbi:hypothetical protein RSSM_01189 [Rhodopirellula sallentina SM41]|uniref:Uncharacterized protein n=1 Tax=Rhodopirellula sallentina SM41 TaxID=1263870 RepID=M5UMW1_9BACT|nr:hypothetical protein RSSM_01189 [Rhodopirellula sallentina SM41]
MTEIDAPAFGILNAPALPPPRSTDSRRESFAARRHHTYPPLKI